METTQVKIPAFKGELLNINIIDINGQKVSVPHQQTPDGYLLEVENLSPGTYLVLLRNAKGIIGTGKFIRQGK